MFKPTDQKARTLHRLKIARGHLEKVIKMVEADAYCIDVLVQSKAVRSAIEKADELLLEHHLSCCVVDHVKQGRSKQAVDEIMKVFAKGK